MHSHARSVVTLSVAAALLVAAGCSDHAVPPQPPGNPEAARAIATLRAWIADLDREIAQRSSEWFTIHGRPTNELVALRSDLLKDLASLQRGQSSGRVGPGPVNFSEESGVPMTIDGTVYPQIEQQQVPVRTYLLRTPAAGSHTVLWHEGSYTAMRNGTPAANGNLSRDSAHHSNHTTQYAMAINFSLAADTVDASASTRHGGRYTPSGAPSQQIAELQRFNTDRYTPPQPPPKPPEDDTPCDGQFYCDNGGGGNPGGGGGGERQEAYPNSEGTVWCYFISYDGGRTWLNTGQCWVV